MVYELFQLKTCPKLYKEFVDMDSSKKRINDLPKDYSDYVKNMSKNGVWGDSVTLQAAADTVNFSFSFNLTLIFNFHSLVLAQWNKSIRYHAVWSENSTHYVRKRSTFDGDCS